MFKKHSIFYKEVKNQYDAILYIVRAQPFHRAHHRNIQIAKTLAKQVIVAVGSSFIAPSPKNPLTFHQRQAMIKAEFPEDSVIVVPIRDYTYNDEKWVTEVRAAVNSVLVSGNPDNNDLGVFYGQDLSSAKIALLGHSKDESSYYLKMFPDWDSIEVPNIDGLNATDIRLAAFVDPEHRFEDVPSKARKVLQDIIKSDNWDFAINEHKFYEDYKEPYKVLTEEQIVEWVSKQGSIDPHELVIRFANKYKPKYPPKHVTADAIVSQSSHVLLIKRKARPGKGLWAMPGGHVNESETIMAAGIRELYEETKLDIPERTLRRCLINEKIYDAPSRSLRGRSITVAYHFDLGSDTKLPKVKYNGSSDSAEVRWFPYNEIPEHLMFEDHYSILADMLKL